MPGIGIANCMDDRWTEVKLLNIEYEKQIPSSNLIAIIEDVFDIEIYIYIYIHIFWTPKNELLQAKLICHLPIPNWRRGHGKSM